MKLVSLKESEEFETKLQPSEEAAYAAEKATAAAHQIAAVHSKLEVYHNALKDGKISQEQYTQLSQQLHKKMEVIGKQAVIKIGKHKIQTPLTTCELAHYVGTPEGYPDLTTTQVALLKDINAGLSAYGLGPMALLIGGRKSKAYNGINFVAVGAGGRMAWRKYDPSPGAGQNWVYLPNIGQMKT
jgi:hypothetical protein